MKILSFACSEYCALPLKDMHLVYRLVTYIRRLMVWPEICLRTNLFSYTELQNMIATGG